MLRIPSLALVVPLFFTGLAPLGLRGENVDSPAPRKLGAVETEPHTKDRGPSAAEIRFKLPSPPALTPEEEVRTIKVPPGFKVEIVAAEPLIEAPIAMSWDEQGRAYVVEMTGYMNDFNGTGEEKPLCRIKRLESSKGDGIFDKATVFVDKLVLPRAVMAMGDGAVVAEPPNLIWYHDHAGTGVSDSSEIMATNYGVKGGQPEHMCNSLTWMLDNWIWSADHGTRYRLEKGKFVMEPIPSRGQWGLSQDDWGRLFHNSNSDLLRCDLLPPQYYDRNPNLTVRTAVNHQAMKDQTTWPSHPTPGVNRGYAEDQLRPDGTLKTVTATCGASVYRGELFPNEFRGNVFIPEPAGNLVKRVILDESEGYISARNAYTGTEFLTSTDERFRPVNTYTGPDGALYVVDMARGIIQHRFFETYYLIENIKDRKLEQPLNLGRIYRIVPVDAHPAPVKLPKASLEIVPYLAHENGWVRDTAQRLLVERGDVSVAPAVAKVAATGATAKGRVHALWTLEGIKALSPDIILASLHDPDPHVRATAVRLADRTLGPELMKQVDDPSIAVRLQLALTLSAQSGPEATQAIVALLRKGGSGLLGEALASGLRSREVEMFEALSAVSDASTAIDRAHILPILAGCVMKEHRAISVARLLDLVSGFPENSARQIAVLEAIAGKATPSGMRGKYIYVDSQPAGLEKLLASGNPAIQKLAAAIDARVAWSDKPGVPPPPKIVPLTVEQTAQFEKGRMLYANICAACHQPGGTGQDGLAPPLLGSEWVLGPAERPIRIVLHGVSGPISVAGTSWRLEMPPLGAALSDDDIANVLTYIRREWEHNADPVSPVDVAKVRRAAADRTISWTEVELKRP